MSRLIVLSNRVKTPENKQAGGLAVAVSSALRQSGGIWLGWNGEILPKMATACDTGFNQTDQTHAGKTLTYVTTALSDAQYQHFYCGFANSVLWAFLHDRVDLISEQAEDFEQYQQVNAAFAKQLNALAEPDDVIWVHDYHFLSVAHYCRKLGMRHRIGFFLHIPFASPQAWQHCSHADTLLRHLGDYDVIGVQTQADKRHCQAVLTPFLARKQPIIDSYPIGVDVPTIVDCIKPKIQAWQGTQTKKSNVIQIISVERIDYTKGILQRLQTFAQFLRQYPSYQGNLQLHQIACPSRLDLPAYQQLYQAVREQVATIQQEFATADWQPIVHSETVLAHDDLMQVLFDSDICWINSLKDGMNLVAKEYMAAQNPRKAGVLLLSKYAGASEQMSQAVLVDPYDEPQAIDSLYTALTMPLIEKQRRYHDLMHGLTQQDLGQWQQDFLHDLYAKDV